MGKGVKRKERKKRKKEGGRNRREITGSRVLSSILHGPEAQVEDRRGKRKKRGKARGCSVALRLFHFLPLSGSREGTHREKKRRKEGGKKKDCRGYRASPSVWVPSVT